MKVLSNFIKLMMAFFVHLNAIEYATISKNEGEKPIVFSIYSERCSGSNYLESLIKLNLDIEFNWFSHKHFPPWFDLPQSAWHGSPEEYTFSGTDNRLFIILFRTPYEWAQSLHQKPWCAAPCLQKMNFSKFIRSPWKIDPNDGTVKVQRVFNPLMDKNPKTGKEFSNIFKLRRAKILNMLQVYNKAKNVYVVTYETIRDYPEQVINEIAHVYGISLKGEFKPVDHYKGNEKLGSYEGSSYPEISSKDLKYINSQLDKRVEKLFFDGY